MKTLEKTSNKIENDEFNIEEAFKELQNQNILLTQQIEELTAKLNWYEIGRAHV